MNFYERIKSKITDGEIQDGIVNTTFLNLYSYMLNRKNVRYFESFVDVRVDGILLVYLFRMFGVRVARTSFDFTSIANSYFELCCIKEYKIFFVGTEQKHLDGFLVKIKSEYPNLKIVGSRNGYFDDEVDYESALKNILVSNPETILVGMGSPYQEKLASDLCDLGWEGAAYTCGGFMHQTASAEELEYYPEWMDKLNLRWLYRIYDEPKLFTRYFWEYPKASCYFIYDATRNILGRSKGSAEKKL